ncbi:hypothetical protein HD806DRAFT_535559 [Xylariaceae sp. AK1471]|nr:hypothetical protein HD806DRAFT_535559 [Xylariaceae sp. AK1471]
MEKASRRRRKGIESRPPLLPDEELELELEAVLDAQVRKIVAIRREIIADLDAVEDRVVRLGSDLRRLHPLPLSNTGRGYGQLIPRALKATDEQRRCLDFEDIGVGAEGKEKVVEKESLLRVFVNAVWFVQEARDVLTFCERCVAKWNFAPRRERECFGEIRTALEIFFPREKGMKFLISISGTLSFRRLLD